MIGNLQRFFNKKNKPRRYGYDSEYDDIDANAEDYFVEESYMDSRDLDDEFFD